MTTRYRRFDWDRPKPITTGNLALAMPEHVDEPARERFAHGAIRASTLCSEAQQGCRDLMRGDLEAAYYSFDRAAEDLAQSGDDDGFDTCAWLRDQIEGLQPGKETP